MQITTQRHSQMYGIIIYIIFLLNWDVILSSFSVSRQYAECFARIKSIRNSDEARKYYGYIFLKNIKKEKKKEIYLYYNAFPKKIVVLVNY